MIRLPATKIQDHTSEQKTGWRESKITGDRTKNYVTFRPW